MKTHRRQVIQAAVFGAVSATGVIATEAFSAPSNRNAANDIRVLNGALFYEHQAIWAYGFAAPRLSQSEVGRAVLAIALANQADHRAHRDTLAQVIRSLGGRPVAAKDGYLETVRPYIDRGEGNLDNDVNIAKLALALEVDAAIAYGVEASQLRTPALIRAGASIGANEATHATVIRSAFKSLGVDIKVVPAAFVSGDTRSQWLIKV